MFAMLHYICQTIVNIEGVELKFLESGHTQMEVDSMHSVIEKEKKGRTVYTPPEWGTIVRGARRKNPYIVEELIYSDFYDVKVIQPKYMT